jgi:hypothetical protein
VEIENQYLRTFLRERLPEFYDDIYKYNRRSNADGYLDLSEEKITNNKFLQRILNLTDYRIEKIYYCSASLSHSDIIGFYFRLDKL